MRLTLLEVFNRSDRMVPAVSSLKSLTAKEFNPSRTSFSPHPGRIRFKLVAHLVSIPNYSFKMIFS